MKRIPIHLLLCGETGVGKDTFAATFPKPMLVWHLDGHGQDIPYIHNKLLGRAQQVGELQNYVMGSFSINYRDIVAADGGFIRIEYYSSDNPTCANVSRVLESRMANFTTEQHQWQTLVCGSLSSVALENRLYEQFVLNPQFKDPRKWYGAATEYVERLISMQKALTCNVVFICHNGRVQDEVGGEMLFTIDLPGRLSYSAGRYFNEIYRVYIPYHEGKPIKDDRGATMRYLQTDHDGRYQAKTHIDASNPCFPHYESLWQSWDSIEGV